MSAAAAAVSAAEAGPEAFADAVAPAGAPKLASAKALQLSSANLAESLAADVPIIRNAMWWDV